MHGFYLFGRGERGVSLMDISSLISIRVSRVFLDRMAGWGWVSCGTHKAAI